MRPLPIPIERLQRLGACAVVIACAGLFAVDALWSPRVPFLRDGASGQWIAAPEPVTAMAQRARLRERTRFSHVVRLDHAAAAASLEISALGDAVVRVNGVIASGPSPLVPGPKRPIRIDLSTRLTAGENRIEIELRRALGPALLHAVLDVDGVRTGTAPDWRVIREQAPEAGNPGLNGASGDARDSAPSGRASPASSPRSSRASIPEEATPRGFLGVESAAVLADDTRTLVEARAVRSAIVELRERGMALFALFAVASAVAWLGLRRGTALAPRLPGLLTGVIVLLWLVVFVTKIMRIDPMLGFDAGGHWEYVQWLIYRRSVPLATDGWSLYHPPLFYVLPAMIIAALGPVHDANASALLVKALPFAGGLVSVLGTAAIARELFPRDPRTTSFAIALAGLSPVALIISSYFSNESWVCAWLVLAMWCFVRLCLADRPGVREYATLGLLLGLALMTKYTAVVVAPVLYGFAALRMLLSRRTPPVRAFALAALPLAPMIALSGWFFVRNVLAFGTPMPANWGDLATPELTWWQQPGFHTAHWYVGFGESLVRPWFAGFASFWDALYCTFWGDGYIAGLLHVADRQPQWHYGWMSVTYPLALPATLVALCGVGIGVHRSLHDENARRRLALAGLGTTAFVLLAALAIVSLRYPYYGQVKAFYVLPALAPFALLGALGFSALDERLARCRSAFPRALVLGAWIGLAAVIALAFLK